MAQKFSIAAMGSTGASGGTLRQVWVDAQFGIQVVDQLVQFGKPVLALSTVDLHEGEAPHAPAAGFFLPAAQEKSAIVLPADRSGLPFLV